MFQYDSLNTLTRSEDSKGTGAGVQLGDRCSYFGGRRWTSTCGVEAAGMEKRVDSGPGGGNDQEVPTMVGS